MFLCKDCHNVDKHSGLFTSYGPCEGCGKTRVCIDCKLPRCEAPKKKKKD